MFLLNNETSAEECIFVIFTIQNVPIKLTVMYLFLMKILEFTIQNVPIKLHPPQATYIVYHFFSFLSIPIFSYIFTQNFFLFFYKTVKKSNKNQYYRKSVDVPAF